MKNEQVVILGSFNTNNGITSFVKQNYSQLKKQGWQFHFINIANAKPARELSSLGHYSEVKQLKLGPVKHVLDLARVLRRNRKFSSVIHMHLDSLHNFLPLLIAKFVGYKRIIVHAHSDQRGQYSWKKEVAQKMGMKICAHTATDFIACSQNAADFFYPKNIQQNDSFKIILNSVNLEKFRYMEVANINVRRKFNINDNTFVVGHCGRFNRTKNHPFILRLFVKVHQLLPDSVLVLVGNGENFIEVKKLAEKLGIMENVIFTGYIKNVSELQNIFDIFLLPSLYEGLSLSLLENAANGTPCLLSDTQSIESYLLDSTYALSIKDGCEKLWADKVFEVSKKHLDKNQQSSINIRQLEKKGFSDENSVSALVKLYEQQ